MQRRSHGGRPPGRLGLVAAVILVGLLGPVALAAQDASPGASPAASPQASPAASPAASPFASPGASPAASPVADLAPEDAPDLAAMMLRTADLDDGFGLSQGVLWGVDVEVSTIAETLGRDPAELRQGLVDAGWQLRYLTFFGLPSEEDSNFVTQSTTSYVTLYEDDSGAEAGFALTEDESTDQSSEDVAGAPELGDQSELTRTTGIDEATSNEFISLDYAFRVDNLVAGVSVTDFSGAEPEQERLIELAELVLARAEAAVAEDGDAPDLFGRIQRLEPSEIAASQYSTEYYASIDGDALRVYNEPEDEVEQRADFLEENNVEASYRYEGYFLPNETTDPNASVAVTNHLYRFADEAAAAAYVDVAAASIVASPGGYENVEALDDLPAFDGEAAGLSYDFPLTADVVASGYRYWVQAGALVVSVQADLIGGVSEDAVIALTDAQLACAGADTFCEPLILPDDLLGG